MIERGRWTRRESVITSRDQVDLAELGGGRATGAHGDSVGLFWASMSRGILSADTDEIDPRTGRGKGEALSANSLSREEERWSVRWRRDDTPPHAERFDHPAGLIEVLGARGEGKRETDRWGERRGAQRDDRR